MRGKLLLFFVVCLAGCTKPNPIDEDRRNARSMAEVFTDDLLSFGVTWDRQSVQINQSGNEWSVTGKVDIQNASGGVLKNQAIVVVMEQTGGDSWLCREIYVNADLVFEKR